MDLPITLAFNIGATSTRSSPLYQSLQRLHNLDFRFFKGSFHPLNGVSIHLPGGFNRVVLVDRKLPQKRTSQVYHTLCLDNLSTEL